jgi:AAA ATPase domain
LDSPLVGRENELAQLQYAFDHAVAERAAYQFTLLGPAGIGKSRLARELHNRIDAALVSGRCLPYGEGITYSPLAEIEPLAAEIDFEANRDEIALQARRILERLARERPLVVVLDDLQWAEPTFFDLVDHVTDLATDAPMLVLCVARPELLDVRPGWGGGKVNATTMLLGGLRKDEATQLVENLLVARVDSTMSEQIAAAAEGNPLYLEEMLTMVAQNGDGDVTVPPTIQALLAARLDRLEADERRLVECAAVQGQEFRCDALKHLAPEPLTERLTDTLQSLVRTDVIRPIAEQTFRFKHLLLRDAAYEALPKERRADLHERFAEWLEAESTELEEILGYHLERAYGYRVELGPADERASRLARRAATVLAASGRRARDRADVPATINLLERVVRLLPDGDADAVALYPDLATAVADTGNFERAEELYRAAEGLRDRATALRARVRRTWLDVMRGGGTAEAVDPLEAAVAEATRLGEPSILAEALSRLGVLATWLGDNDKGEQLLRSSLEHAESLDDVRLRSEVTHWLALGMTWGRTPVDNALRECRALRQAITVDARARTELLVAEALLLAMTGEFGPARQLGAEGRRGVRELGQKVRYAAVTQPVATIELLAGDAPAAERLLREAHEILTAAGERAYLSTVSALLAVALVRQERYAEADAFAEESRRIGTQDDIVTLTYWRNAKANVLGASGNVSDAARLAAETIEIPPDYDSFDAPLATVEVARLLEPDAARPALERAVAGPLAKGNTVTAAPARAQLEALS